jgi:thiamine biosynthesis lipoprotein
MQFRFCSFVFCFIVLSGCAPQDPIQKFSGPAQGATYNISYWSEQEINKESLQQQVEVELSRIDKLMSNYRKDSVIEAFNTKVTTESFEVGSELVDLVRIAREVSSQSQGCYDLTIKPLFDLWGFKADQFNQPSPEQIASVLAKVGMAKISEDGPSMLSKKLPDMRVDVSSIAQGYTVQRLATLLEQAGVQNYLVEVGGELQVRGKKPEQKPWKLAIEKPLPGEQTLQKIITVEQNEPLAVMTSGTYRHYFDANGKRFSHVIDARTGAPVQHQTVSTTVFIENSTYADAWSTAFLCLGSQDGKAVADRLGLKVLFIDQHGNELHELASDALRQTKAVTLQ